MSTHALSFKLLIHWCESLYQWCRRCFWNDTKTKNIFIIFWQISPFLFVLRSVSWSFISKVTICSFGSSLCVTFSLVTRSKLIRTVIKFKNKAKLSVWLNFDDNGCAGKIDDPFSRSVWTCLSYWSSSRVNKTEQSNNNFYSRFSFVFLLIDRFRWLSRCF